jgi:hypothetical protein
MDTPIFINMRKYFAIVKGVSSVFLLVLLFSCMSLPVEETEIQPETALSVPENPVVERPMPPEEIMGKGMASEDKLTLFLISSNARKDPDFAGFARFLTGIYIEEAAAEGVNHDVAFAQMCLETGSLRFGGLVTPEMNNYCGLGSTGAPGPNGPEKGAAFPNPRTGVRAHIQHLKAYATSEPLNQDLVDPRYSYVKLGCSPTIKGLAGRWAADIYYSKKLTATLKLIYEFSF